MYYFILFIMFQIYSYFPIRNYITLAVQITIRICYPKSKMVDTSRLKKIEISIVIFTGNDIKMKGKASVLTATMVV